MDKPVHLATLIRPDGSVAALCAPRPRRLDLTRASWTLRPAAVTCPRCRARLAAV